jgi:hypothetical protein
MLTLLLISHGHVDECNPKSGVTIHTDAVARVESVDPRGVALLPRSALSANSDTDKPHFIDGTSDFPGDLLRAPQVQYKVMSSVDVQVNCAEWAEHTSVSKPGAEHMTITKQPRS